MKKKITVHDSLCPLQESSTFKPHLAMRCSDRLKVWPIHLSFIGTLIQRGSWKKNKGIITLVLLTYYIHAQKTLFIVYSTVTYFHVWCWNNYIKYVYYISVFLRYIFQTSDFSNESYYMINRFQMFHEDFIKSKSILSDGINIGYL